nr:MAG TPA: hypothetical protein [Caudoviricetes sp.]
MCHAFFIQNSSYTAISCCKARLRPQRKTQDLFLSDANNVKRIITFVNGSAGSICLSQDFDI